MATELFFKTKPHFQSDMWDEYCAFMGKERLLHVKKILKGTRYTASTALDYENLMNSFLYFDNGLLPSDVEAAFDIPHSTTLRHHRLYKNIIP